jgi:hypothetical protein
MVQTADENIIDLDKIIEDSDIKRGIIRKIQRNIKLERGIPSDAGPDEEPSEVEE